MLHIGCGDIDAAGYINIDARPQAHVHITATSLFELEMIPSGVADLIYMSHVLEHVGHRQVVSTLREMHRILKKGGVLRISVPDFDSVLDIYMATDKDVSSIEQPLMGGQDYPFNFHYAVFNAKNLTAKLLQSGFNSTRTWQPNEVSDHDFEDWASRSVVLQGQAFPISLNIEAVK